MPAKRARPETAPGGVGAGPAHRPVYVDTHAHLYLDAFDADRDAVVERARAAGVTRILHAGRRTSPRSTPRSRSRTATTGVWAMAAIHPTYGPRMPPDDAGRASSRARPTRASSPSARPAWTTTGAATTSTRSRRLLRGARPAGGRARPAARAPQPRPERVGRERVARTWSACSARCATTAPGGEPARRVPLLRRSRLGSHEDVLDLGFHVGLGGTLTLQERRRRRGHRDVPLDRIVLETDAPLPRADAAPGRRATSRPTPARRRAAGGAPRPARRGGRRGDDRQRAAPVRAGRGAGSVEVGARHGVKAPGTAVLALLVDESASTVGAEAPVVATFGSSRSVIAI